MSRESVKCKGVMRGSVEHGNKLMSSFCASRFTPSVHRRGQAVLLATLIMFVVAAVGAGFILFVQGSMNLSQRTREEAEALLLAQAGLAFADAQLTEHGADWRPSIMVDIDEFERSKGWHRPDSENDWYGKYAARQVVDLLGNVAGSGAFLIKVKYLPNEQVLKIISIGRPRPNSPVYRRLVGYKVIPSDWIWVTARNEGSPDPLLVDANQDNVPEVLLGHEINWTLAQVGILNAERDPLEPVVIPANDPQRLSWLRLRTWLGSARLPIWDQTVVFTSTIRVNSDLLWYGSNALSLTSFFAASQTILEVARTISHDTNAQVLVYDWQDGFQGLAQPSAFGTPPGSGFVFFPIGGVPRYLDGWERIGGLIPVRWVFNFPRRTQPRAAAVIDLGPYYAQTRDVVPYGYYRIPEATNGPIQPTLNPDGFYVSDYSAEAPLLFRGIYIGNTADRQFETPADAPDVDGDGTPDPVVFVDANRTYHPELAQVYDWFVKPPQAIPDPNNPNQLVLHPRRLQPDSGWLQDYNINAPTERNIVESFALDANNQPQPLPFAYRGLAPNLYVPPGVEVRFDVVQTNNPAVVLQRTWLIRHDGQTFLAPNGNQLSNRLAFIDAVQLTAFDADGDGNSAEDPVNFNDDDNDGRVDEDPPATAMQVLNQPYMDNDGDGRVGEDPIDGVDNDGDGRVDEDPPIAQPSPQMPTIVIVAEGNIRVSGQVAVNVKIVTRESIYVEGALYSITSNATIELLAKRNVCINFAAARTPIPSLDGLNPQVDRALLIPQFRIVQISAPPNQVFGIHHLLPNLPINPQVDPRLPVFADLSGGSVGAIMMPVPIDNNGDGLVDSSASLTYALSMPLSLPISADLQNNLAQLQNGVWTLRLVLLHRGLTAVPDPNSPTGWQPVRNPWTNLEVDLWFDENGNGIWDANEPRTRLYGPAELMRTFPVASRWYQGDGRPVDPNDPTTEKEWGVLDIPIPLSVAGLLVDRDNDGQITLNDLRLALQRLRVTVISPVANETIPQGRTPVPYELAGIKLALYDEHGIPRPIWQAGSPWFVLAQTIHAENGTVGIVPPPYFDPTAHPSWQRLIASNDPNWQTRFRQWQRLWSFYYLRHNSVRWSTFVDPANLPLAQSVPILAGQLIVRVTPQTMLWRLMMQSAFGNPNDPNDPRPDFLKLAWELGLDKASLPYSNDLNVQNKLADLMDLQRATAPIFVEVPRTMFASAWLWAWRAAPVQGVLNLGNGILPQYYRAPIIPNLNLPKGYAMVLQQQVGKD